MRKLFVYITLMFSVGYVSLADASVYKVDPDHSSVSFKVKHLFSWVQGNFNEFEGVIHYEKGKPDTWHAEGTIQANSIDTRVAERDKHLRSKDFFDIENYPTVTFQSVKTEAMGPDKAKVHGLLTIHGVERPVIMDVAILGEAKDPWGNVAMGFQVSTQINRKDFGLTWNQALETGGVLVGEEVLITLDVAALLDE